MKNFYKCAFNFHGPYSRASDSESDDEDGKGKNGKKGKGQSKPWDLVGRGKNGEWEDAGKGKGKNNSEEVGGKGKGAGFSGEDAFYYEVSEHHFRGVPRTPAPAEASEQHWRVPRTPLPGAGPAVLSMRALPGTPAGLPPATPGSPPALPGSGVSTVAVTSVPERAEQ